MKYIIIYFFFFTVFLIPFNTFSQSKKELEKRKNEKLNEIKKIENLIDQTKELKSSSYYKIELANRKIKLREEIINDIEDQIVELDTNISLTNKEIIKKYDKIESLKREYAQTIFNLYYKHRNYNSILFILSASDFNSAYRRLYYLKQYSEHRKKIIDELNNEIALINNYAKDLTTQKSEKVSTLTEREKEKLALENDKESFKRLVNQYTVKEKELKRELQTLQDAAKKIEEEIKKIIEEEIRQARLRKTTVKSTNVKYSAEFSKNKGRFICPVDNGVIKSQFGEHPHPILKSVKVKNNGVDFNTTCRAQVRCIFNGKVSKVFSIKGANFAVIIRHGDYLTVYQNLKEVNVKADEEIKTNEVIGTLYCNENENNSTLHFEIWHELEKLNPEDWINKSFK